MEPRVLTPACRVDHTTMETATTTSIRAVLLMMEMMESTRRLDRGMASSGRLLPEPLALLLEEAAC